MGFLKIATTVALFTATSALVTHRENLNHLVHEKRDILHDEWKIQERAEKGDILPIKIALRERNLEHAERYIMDVSDPLSENYGKHWTAEEVANTFLPSAETNDKVVEWLEQMGVETSRITHSTGHNWLQFDATVEEAEHLFHTQYHNYEHVPSGSQHPACDSYSLPQHIREHVDFVLPTIHLGALRIRKRGLPGNSLASKVLQHAAGPQPTYTGLTGTKNCNEIITIDCLRALYKFPAGSTANPSNVMGVAEWDQYLYEPDLDVFFANLTSPKIPKGTRPEFVSIDGGKKHYGPPGTNNRQFGSYIGESAIDFQTSYSIIYPQKLRWYAVGDGVNVNSVGTFNIFLDALDASYCKYEGGDSPKYDPHYPDPKKGGYKGKLQCGGAPTSHITSISYGQEEVNLSPAYERRQCHEYMKLGLQGVSIVYASGDSGVAQRYNAGFDNKCLAAHSNKKSVDGPRFSPGFPQTCPYVTSVGATTLRTKSIDGGEKAVHDYNKRDPDQSFYSGGGFSNVFTLPSYQTKAVTHYLTKYPPPYTKDQYNNSGNARGYPDVSAIGINGAVAFNGSIYNFGGGTSLSAPIFASIMTLVNEARLSAGKSVVGFMNPVFYANPGAFNDIIHGDNPGCNTTGFAARPGWDPVTGLGSPDFEKLKKVFLDLPSGYGGGS